MSLFSYPDKINALPPNIASTITELMYEREHSGVHTTPDETAHVIEAYFQHAGRIWISELLYLASSNPEHFQKASASGLFTWLFDLVLQTRKSLQMGRWVSICRTIQQFFYKNALTPFTNGLETIDYGTYGDDEHPVAQIVSFRNQFAHGSYEALEEEINHHYHLIENMIESITGFTSQPIIAETDGRWFKCQATIEEIPRPENPSDTVFMLDKTGNQLPLSPFFALFLEDASLELQLSGFEYMSADDIFTSEALHTWMLRYQNEREGHISSQPIIESLAPVPLPPQVQSELKKMLNTQTGRLNLIQAHSGTGYSSIIQALNNQTLSHINFDAQIIWACKPNTLHQSGYTFLQHIFRQFEQILDLPKGRFGNNRGELFVDLQQAQQQLSEQNKKVLIGIHALEHGQHEYRREGLTLIEVYNKLIHPSLWVIATSEIPPLGLQIFYDETYFYPNTEIISQQHLQEALQQHSQNALNKAILQTLAQSDAPMNLFQVCDALDEIGQDSFEPRVERRLWSMQSLLNVGSSHDNANPQIERVRTWSVFHQEVVTLLEAK